MSRVANAPIDNSKPIVKKLVADISEVFDAHVDLYVVQHDIARSDLIRKFCADGFGYVGTGDELALRSRSSVYAAAGEKRKRTSTMVKGKAEKLDELKSLLLSGALTPEDLAEMFRAL